MSFHLDPFLFHRNSKTSLSMTQAQETRTGHRPIDSHTYRGKFQEQQVYGNNYRGRRYGSHDALPLNDYQKFLYDRALFGLAVYSQEEIKQMHWDKRKRIIKVHKRAQEILNLWKQDIIVKLSNHLFTTFFPKTEITKSLVEDSSPTDSGYNNKMSFKSLRITKDQIINKLMDEGVLPMNFMELKPVQHAG